MTARPRVVLAEPIHPSGLERLREFTDVEVAPGTAASDLYPALDGADALIVRASPVDASLMVDRPSLRVIGRHGAGTDNIDLEAAARHRITVVNTPSSNTETVAEYVVMMAQLLVRRILDQSEALRTGRFSDRGRSLPGHVAAADLVGGEARGTTLGVVGAGQIGQAVARRAQQLGMQVAAYDPVVDPSVLRASDIEVHSSLHALLGSVDVVSLHVPGGPATRGLIGATELRSMRPGTFLINAARGDVIDAYALRDAVRQGRLGGAVIDVFDPEPPPVDHPLLDEPGVLVTPHVAGVTQRALEQLSIDVAQGVLDVLAGRMPQHPVVSGGSASSPSA